MRKVAIVAASLISTLTMGAGVVGAQANTGPGSRLTTRNTSTTSHKVMQSNTVSATNNNPQKATTGDAWVTNNSDAGDASTGHAANNADLTADISVTNSGGGMGSDMSMPADTTTTGSSDMGSGTTTGPDSSINTSMSTKDMSQVNSTNHVMVSNNVNQTAKSGDARVSNNTNAGNAMTGDAMNTSTTMLTINASN